MAKTNILGGYWKPTEATKKAAERFAVRHGLSTIEEVQNPHSDTLLIVECEVIPSRGDSALDVARKAKLRRLWDRIKARNQANQDDKDAEAVLKMVCFS